MTNDHLPTTNPCNREIYIDRFTLGSSQLFPDSSWRNKPLADNATLVDQATSDRLVGSLVSQVNAYGTWVEKGDRFNVPVYTVPASQATVPVRLDTRYKTWWSADWSEWRKQFGNVPIPSYAKASGPTDCSGDGEFIGVWSVYAMCNGNQADWSDREIAIYQPATDTVWELEHLVKFNGEWSAIDGGRISNVSQAQQYDGQPLPVSHLYHGVAASRIPLLATIQRRSEVLNGAIHHPVAIAVPHVEGTFADRQHQLSPATFPALASDGDFATSDAIREGTWFRLPRSVPIDSLNMAPYARIFAHAAQDYGIIVTDKDCAAPDPTKPPPTGDPCMPPNRHADVGTSVEDPYPAYGAVTYGSSNDPYRNLIPSTSDGSSTALDGFPWDQLVVVAPPPQ
jgi:hypothetical protein